MMEQVLQDMAAATDLRAVLLRYFNPIGSDPELQSGVYAREPSHVLGQMTLAALGQRDAFTVTGTDFPTRDGTGIRDYLHVWDLALAHVAAVDQFDKALEQADGPSTVVNVGTGQGVTVRELLAIFEEVFGRPVPTVDAPPRPGDVVGAFANVDKARDALGWSSSSDGRRRRRLRAAVDAAAPRDPRLRLTPAGRACHPAGRGARSASDEPRDHLTSRAYTRRVSQHTHEHPSPTGDWQSTLRSKGYRLTPQRELVLRAVERLGHATPDEVLTAVREESQAVNVSTVYRTLELLEELGLVRHAHITDRAPTYHSAAAPAHVHLVCRACHSITEVEPEVIDAAHRAACATTTASRTDVGHLTIFGTCRDCPGD